MSCSDGFSDPTGYVADAEVPELTRLATTISGSEQEVLSFHVTGISTGPVEAQNLVTEKIRRIFVYRPSTAGGSREPPLVQRRGGHWDHHRSWR